MEGTGEERRMTNKCPPSHPRYRRVFKGSSEFGDKKKGKTLYALGRLLQGDGKDKCSGF